MAEPKDNIPLWNEIVTKKYILHDSTHKISENETYIAIRGESDCLQPGTHEGMGYKDT